MTDANNQIVLGIVARALGCAPELLSMDSAMYRHHGWDSFGHIAIISALEAAYRITIPNDFISTLVTMRSIVEFVDNLPVDHRSNDRS